LRAAADFPCHFPPDLRVVAFFLDFLLAALEALSLLAGEAGESFVAGFFFVFVFVAVFQLLLLGVIVDGATTVPDVFFDFLSPICEGKSDWSGAFLQRSFLGNFSFLTPLFSLVLHISHRARIQHLIATYSYVFFWRASMLKCSTCTLPDFCESVTKIYLPFYLRRERSKQQPAVRL